LLKQDAGFRHWLEQLIRQTAVTPESFDARFERMLQEFAADRAEQRQRWDEQNRRWDEQNRRWDEQNPKHNELLEEIKLSRSRQDQGIGALGNRLGTQFPRRAQGHSGKKLRGRGVEHQ
jgi:hypothetical protein